MKKLLLLVSIASLFSGCATDTKLKLVSPKGHTIDAKMKPLPTRVFEYQLVKAGEVMTLDVDSAVLSLRDARWYVAKMNRCVKNGRKLEVALGACNEQILVMGDLNEKQ